MAQLFKIAETRSWINDWLREPHGARHIHRAALEQRANKDGLMGRATHWCDINEYEKCVQLLERTSTRLKKQAEAARARAIELGYSIAK